MSAPLRLPSPCNVGFQFTFTPKQGWRSNAGDAASSPPPAVQPASSSSQPPSAGSTSSPLLFPSSSSLSISPTLGFDCSARALPAMVSSRAHVRLQRHSSAPATPSPPRRKRSRRARHSDDEWSEATAAGGEPQPTAAASEQLETGSALMETEEGEEELRAITRQPLSILVSPVSCKRRPHCPVPLSPSQTDSSSLQSSACSSSASPRRPLFINQIVSMGEGSALLLTRRSGREEETARPSAPSALTDTPDRLPELLPFSPLAVSSSSCSSLTTPASASLTAAVCRSLSCDSAVRRCRSQWRRFHHAEDAQSGAGRLQRCASDAPQRRITPLLLPPEAEREHAGKAAASPMKEETDSTEELASRGGKAAAAAAAAARARRTTAVSVKRRSRRRLEQSQSQSRIVDFFSSL